MQTYSRIVLLAVVSAAFMPSQLSAQRHDSPPHAAATTADELKQNFAAEHDIGRRFHIDPVDLPAPKAGPIVTNRSLTLPYDGQVPQVPPGFEATPL